MKVNNPIEYENRIQEILISDIEINKLNPRKKFIESEEDELIDSIDSKGILNPIIVYKKKRGRYVLLDGERRFRACLKLNYDTIPAHVLKEEPDTLENLSMMFHIHNVREEWTDFAIALSLREVIKEMGKDVMKLLPDDIKTLTKHTSLSRYKVNKYLSFLKYPQEVIDRFLKSEKKEKPDKGVDPDILAEMHRPIKIIKDEFPSFIKKYPVPKIIEACIKKKAHNSIKNNREFRFLTKSLTAVKKGKVRKEVMEEKLIDFVKNVNITPENIYADTSEIIYLLKGILDKTKYLYDELQNLDLRKLTNVEKETLGQQLGKLLGIIKEKIIR
jgi:ParB family chromosome partitioning protein